MLSWEYAPRIVGGLGRHVTELSQALAEAGLEVDVLTAHHPGPPDEERREAGPGSVRALRAAPDSIYARDFIGEIHQLNFALLTRLLRAGPGEWDLIHAHDWLVGFAAHTLKHGLELPMVATIHGTEAGRNHGIHDPTQHYIHTVEWLLTYEAWRVICCSRYMEDEVAHALATPRDKLRVVPNGVDPARVRWEGGAEELAEFRSRWAAPWERIVLFVGRLVREKGLEVLVDALPRVLAVHPEAKLVICGGGWEADLRGRVHALGVGHKVVFTGFLPEEDLPRMYAVAEVAAFPSLYEPFGIVALEAMAAGVPVVCSDIGGFREVVEHGRTGLHTWANNPESLAWGINQVLGDSGLAARLRQEGRREVEGRYAWPAIARRTLEIYEEVLAGAGAGAEGARPAWAVRPRYLAGREMHQRS